MEDKVLTEKESLDLISQMIRNTRSRLEDNSGIPFLIWGYTTVIVAVIVWSLVTTSGNRITSYNVCYTKLLRRRIRNRCFTH